MKLCDLENQTYASLIYFHSIKVVKEREITGDFGSCLDKLLIKKSLRKCRIIGENNVGTKLSNGSFSGIMGLLQTEQIDAFLMGQPDYMTENWHYETLPMTAEEVVIGHYFNDKNGTSYYDLIDNFKIRISFLSIYLSILLISILICLFINEIAYRIKFGKWKQPNIQSIKRLILVSKFFKIKKFSAIGLFILFVHQFIWFNRLFINNSIRTNKVVVDTSDLVQTEQDLFSSKRTACFLDKETEMNLINSDTSLANSKILLNRIYNLKTKFRVDQIKEKKAINNERCFLSRDLKMMSLLDSDVYYVTTTTLSNFLTSFFSEFNQNRKFWLSPKSVAQFNSVVYYGQRNRINKIYWKGFDLYPEFGITHNMYRCFRNCANWSAFKNKHKLVTNLYDYIDENSKFSNLEFKNFQTLIVAHFSICSLIFVAFCFHHSIKFIKIAYHSIKKSIHFVLTKYLIRVYSKCIKLINRIFLNQ